MVDFVGRFEDLQTDYDTICERVGMPRCVLSKSNTSAADENAYWEHYDFEAAEVVSSVFADEIACFKYEFAG